MGSRWFSTWSEKLQAWSFFESIQQPLFIGGGGDLLVVWLSACKMFRLVTEVVTTSVIKIWGNEFVF